MCLKLIYGSAHEKILFICIYYAFAAYTGICAAWSHFCVHLKVYWSSTCIYTACTWANKESIQSSTTLDPGYQWESDIFTIRHQTRAKRSALSQQVTTRHQQTDAYENITKARQKKPLLIAHATYSKIYRAGLYFPVNTVVLMCKKHSMYQLILP